MDTVRDGADRRASLIALGLPEVLVDTFAKFEPTTYEGMVGFIYRAWTFPWSERLGKLMLAEAMVSRRLEELSVQIAKSDDTMDVLDGRERALDETIKMPGAPHARVVRATAALPGIKREAEVLAREWVRLDAALGEWNERHPPLEVALEPLLVKDAAKRQGMTRAIVEHFGSRLVEVVMPEATRRAGEEVRLKLAEKHLAVWAGHRERRALPTTPKWAVEMRVRLDAGETVEMVLGDDKAAAMWSFKQLRDDEYERAHRGDGCCAEYVVRSAIEMAEHGRWEPANHLFFWKPSADGESASSYAQQNRRWRDRRAKERFAEIQSGLASQAEILVNAALAMERMRLQDAPG